MSIRTLNLHPYYGNAGRAPMLISASAPCRVKVADTRPDISDPGQLISAPTTFTGHGYVWVAAPMTDVTASPPMVQPPQDQPLVGWIVNPVGGLDDSGHDGTEAKPFATVGRAADAMATSPILTTYVRAGRVVEKKPWSLGNGMSLLAHPKDAARSMIIVNAGARSGATSKNGVTLKGLQFEGGIEFDDCLFKVFECGWATSGDPNLQFFGPRAGTRIQANEFAGLTWDPSHPNWGVYPLNGVWNDGKDSDDVTISDNKGKGGTFAFQLQRQGNGVMTRLHVDRNDLRGWGSSLATVVGNEGISMVAGGDPRNTENTCMDNILIQSADRGTVWAVGVEATTASCTYRNTIDAQGGYAFGSNPGIVCDGDVFTLPNPMWAAYGNDGGYAPDGIDIRRYSVNGVAFVGPGGVNVQCNPRPSATGNPVFQPSPKYVSA
jgi:hypothetical protein